MQNGINNDTVFNTYTTAIYIKTLTNKTIVLNHNPQYTITQIKNLIQDKEGIQEYS